MAHAEHVLELLQRPRPELRPGEVAVRETCLNRLLRMEIYARQLRDAGDSRDRARALTGLYAELRTDDDYV